MFQGLRADRVAAFEALADTDGRPVDIADLAPDEVYIDDEGARALGAVAGDEIQVVLGEGAICSVHGPGNHRRLLLEA